MLKRLAVLCLLLPLVAFAETGLVHRCFDSDGNGKNSDACAVRGWVRPGPGDAILSSLDAASASWQTGVFRTWSTMPASAVVMRCNSDVPIGQFGAIDPCGDGVKPFFVKAAIQLPVTTPPSPPPVQVSGTSLVWTVQPVANLVGFKVYHGTTAPLTLLATIANPATTTYAVTLAGLYEVSAYTASAESVRSNRVTVTLPVTPPPVTPPANECVSDPLLVTSVSWRSARTGRRSNTFSTNKALASYTFNWPQTGPRVLTVTDTRGCVATVTR